MWTKTRMLWTIFVLGFLLQYTNADAVTTTHSVASPDQSTSLAQPPSSASTVITVQPRTSAPPSPSAPPSVTTPKYSSAAPTSLSSNLKITTPSIKTAPPATFATIPTSGLPPTSKGLTSASQGSTASATTRAITTFVNGGTSPQPTTNVKATTSNSTTAQGSTQTKAPITPSSSTRIHTTAPNISITSASSNSNLPGPTAQDSSVTQSSTAKFSTNTPSALSTNSKDTSPSVTDSPIVKTTKITATTNRNAEAVTTQVTRQKTIPTTALNRSPSTGSIKPFSMIITLEKIQDTTNNDILVRTCRKLLKSYNIATGCDLEGNERDNGFDITSVNLTVDLSEAKNIYNKEKMSEPQPTPMPSTLIAILSSCGALLLFLACFALYCVCHHRSYRKNQQHLTEELQTVENGYHDNPTLEVMEVQPEMQEKKLTLNGEFNDSWIVPIDNLAKEDIPDEEDTHL
ncbi:hypothetical protein AOLI_G00312480 [Acnodon oligacanthus]